MAAVSKTFSDYYYSLDTEAKKRYDAKVAFIEGQDPYAYKDYSEDISLLPKINHPDIIVYLLYTSSFVTLEEVRNYKSLASYKFFTAGWVLDVRWKDFPKSNQTLVIAKVRHSYSSAKPLRPWILIKSNGSVSCGHCTCMAGKGETCSHIGAVLYWLETKVRIRDETTCTSKDNTWIMPSAVKDVPFLRLEDIDFSSAEKKMTTKPSIQPQPQPQADQVNSLVKDGPGVFSDFLKEIDGEKDPKKRPIILSVTSKYSSQFTQSLEHLPLDLPSMFDPAHLQLDYRQLVEAASNLPIPVVSTIQQTHLEELTRLQAQSKMWFKFRAGRITASRLYQVVHTNPHMPSVSLLNSVCYPETLKFSTAASN